MKNNFYVYEWYIKDTDEIFYVGKGTGRRKNELHNRNLYFNNVYKKYECDVRIIKNNLTNEQACCEEIKRIAELRNINQAKCNLTDGGDGFSSGKLNPTYRISHKGKLNQFYGKKHSEETKLKISKNRKGKGGLKGKLNPMYRKHTTSGKRNGMYGRTGLNHPNSKMYEVIIDDEKHIMTYKECEKLFGIAFSRIYNSGGILHYKKKTANSIYEGLEVIRIK